MTGFWESNKIFVLKSVPYNAYLNIAPTNSNPYTYPITQQDKKLNHNALLHSSNPTRTIIITSTDLRSHPIINPYHLPYPIHCSLPPLFQSSQFSSSTFSKLASLSDGLWIGDTVTPIHFSNSSLLATYGSTCLTGNLWVVGFVFDVIQI